MTWAATVLNKSGESGYAVEDYGQPNTDEPTIVNNEPAPEPQPQTQEPKDKPADQVEPPKTNEPPVTEPPAPVDNKQTTEPEPPKDAPKTEPVSPQIDDETVAKYLSEQKGLTVDLKSIGDQLKSLDMTKAELEKFKNEYGNLSEADKAYLKYRQQGGTLETWANIQMKDFDKMEPGDAIRFKMQMDNPDLPAELIEIKLQDKYKLDLDGDDLSPEEIKAKKLAQAELLIDARGARQSLNELKAKESVPDQERQRQAMQTQMEEVVKKYQAEAESVIDGFSSLKLQVNDKETVDYQVNKETLAKIAPFIKDAHMDGGLRLLKAFPTMNDLVEALYYVHDKKNIQAHLSNQVRSKAEEGRDKLYNNDQPLTSDKAPAVTTHEEVRNKAVVDQAPKAWGLR